MLRAEISKNNHKSDFTYILQVNTLVQEFSNISLLIKVNSLNALLLAQRYKSELKGYIVVTEELINFSTEMMNFTVLLQKEISNKIQGLSQLLRAEMYGGLLKRANIIFKKQNNGQSHFTVSKIIKETDIRSLEFVNSVEVINDNITRLLGQGRMFDTKGQFLAMQARLEGSAITSRDNTLLLIADELQESAHSLKKLLKALDTALYLNLATIKQKAMELKNSA